MTSLQLISGRPQKITLRASRHLDQQGQAICAVTSAVVKDSVANVGANVRTTTLERNLNEGVIITTENPLLT